MELHLAPLVKEDSSDNEKIMFSPITLVAVLLVSENVHLFQFRIFYSLTYLFSDYCLNPLEIKEHWFAHIFLKYKLMG